VRNRRGIVRGDLAEERLAWQDKDYKVLILPIEEAMPDDSVTQLIALFRKRSVMPMPDIARALAPRSSRSLFRDLSALGYLSSYSHTGRYYTLRSIPQFDADGLWRFEGIGFSRDGTLLATALRLVETAEAGRTQRELQLRLGVRVHNPLLELVERKQLRREVVEDEYVYVAGARARAAEQLERRRVRPEASVSVTLELEVLLEVIHATRLPVLDAQTLAARLSARGVRASAGEVTAVLTRHGLEKKLRGRPSQRSPR